MIVGSVSRCNSLEFLGEASRVALQWSGHNSMTTVSGCPWWCPICITRYGFKVRLHPNTLRSQLVSPRED